MVNALYIAIEDLHNKNKFVKVEKFDDLNQNFIVIIHIQQEKEKIANGITGKIYRL